MKQRTNPLPWLALPAVLLAVFWLGLARSRPVTTAQATPQAAAQTQPLQPVALKWRVAKSYPHDTRAYTQGLLWHDGGFYEGTGGVGESQLRRVSFPSGRVMQRRDLPKDVFGEGVALVGDQLFQLTWQSHRGFVYDRDSFKLLREFSYANEGWGLTFDGKQLIQSDGTATLNFLDPQTLKSVRQLAVTANGQPLPKLNELEWIDGAIWANVWETENIAKIDPTSGQVTAYLDLTGLLPPQQRTGKEDVLNGIAYDAEKKRFFVTGKRWPRLFEIQIQGGGV